MTTAPTTKDGLRVRAVQALYRTQTDTMYLIPQLTKENPAVSLALGSGRECQIRIDDEAVAKVHCFLVCTRHSVTLRRFEDNPIKINNARLAEGEIELSANNVITLSEESELVVCDERLKPTPEITVVDLGQFVHRAQELYKDKTQAAAGVNVPRRTFAGWIEKREVCPTGRCGDRVVCGAG